MPPSQIDTHAARMDTSSDRRTFLKQGLLAAGGLALGSARRGRGRPQAGAEHPGDPRRPAAHARVDARRRAALRADAQPGLAARGRRQLRPPLHRLQRLLALAWGAPDGALLPPDGLHDHRRQPSRPGLSDVGDAAARARLLDLVVGQVASQPQPRRLARALRLLRRHLPLAQRLPGAGHRGRSGDRRPVRRMAAPRRGRRAVVRDGLVRQPPRHRLVVPLHRSDPLGELPARARRRRCPATSRRPKRSKRSASPSCSARCRTPPRAPSAPSPSPAPKRSAGGRG